MDEPSRPKGSRRRGASRRPGARDAATRLAAARLGMDDYAREIFDLWFGGKAEPEVVFDDERWGAYMAAVEALREQILRRLAQHAQQLRMLMNTTDFARGSMNLVFHPDVGGQAAECTTGCDVLGASTGYGDSRIAGSFVSAHALPDTGPFARFAAPPAASECGYAVTYSGLVITFCTRVDAETRWTAQGAPMVAAREIARALGAEPRDFTLRVRWAYDAPVRIEVPAPPVFGAPRHFRFR